MRTRWVALLTVAVLVAVGASAIPAGADDDGWDPRIVDVVRDVERLRGLEFAHSVPVEVLSDAAFEKRFAGDETPTMRERESWDQYVSLLVALGLLDKPVDLEATERATGTNVAGIYDVKRGTIVMRGSKLDDPATRVTLVHELTHALQDQHFDLRALDKRADRADSGLTRALFEGDATAIEYRYYWQLGDAEQRAVDRSYEADVAEVTALPPILEAFFQAPYLLGYEAVAVLMAAKGRAGLDDVLHRPPTRDLGLVDPVSLLGRPDWERVATPTLDPGDVAKGDPFPMDATALYLILAEHLPWTEALDVAQRWGGDRSVVFDRAGLPCAAMRIAGRAGADDAVAIGDAFRRWATSGGTDTTVVDEGDRVVVTLCDPVDHTGAATPIPPAQAMTGLTLRNDLVAELLDADWSARVASCAADRFVRLPEATAMVASVTTLSDEPSDELATALRDALSEDAFAIIGECRRGS